MRLKKHIFLIIYAVFFLLICIFANVMHYVLSSKHVLSCHFITLCTLVTSVLGTIYILRGYQKKDNIIHKMFIGSCVVCILTQIIQCVYLVNDFPHFAKASLFSGGTSVFLLGGLLFGKDLGKKKSLIMSSYTILLSITLLVTFVIIAREPIFKLGNVSMLTIMFDLACDASYSGILTISMILKYKDKEERNTK